MSGSSCKSVSAIVDAQTSTRRSALSRLPSPHSDARWASCSSTVKAARQPPLRLARNTSSIIPSANALSPRSNTSSKKSVPLEGSRTLDLAEDGFDLPSRASALRFSALPIARSETRPTAVFRTRSRSPSHHKLRRGPQYSRAKHRVRFLGLLLSTLPRFPPRWLGPPQERGLLLAGAKRPRVMPG